MEERLIKYDRLETVDTDLDKEKFVIEDWLEHIMRSYNKVLNDHDWYDEYVCDLEYDACITIYGKRLEYDDEFDARKLLVEKKRKADLKKYKELQEQYGDIDFSKENI